MEVGKMIQGENSQIKKDGYVILATLQANHKLRNLNENINNMDLVVTKKYLRNHVAKSKKDYHFGSTGEIPCTTNIKFVIIKKEPSAKKASDDTKDDLLELEKKYFLFSMQAWK